MNPPPTEPLYVVGLRQHLMYLLERQELEDHGLAVKVWKDTSPELPMSDIDDCFDAMEYAGIDVVIGIGGGSCLDLGSERSLDTAR